MQKQAPTFGRLLTMTLFALSCFGLLLFLWLSFGGPIPLKPQGYRFKVALPGATQLGLEADVRVAGISVGKVVRKDLYNGPGNATVATVEVDPRFAPIHVDDKAILRQKTLLGETYLELTPGTHNSQTVRDNGWLPNGQVQNAVTLDEIFNALDPKTRQAFRTWQQSMAPSIQDRGPAFNDALGNLPGFATSGNDLLTVLDQRKQAVTALIFNTGTVFNALSRNEAQLRNLITGSSNVFSATASQNEALAQTFKIFPTFLDESKSTLARLRTFSQDTDPLIRDLKPVARDLVPTLRSVKGLAPDLKRFFIKLDPLIKASKKGLPALRDTLNGLTPLLAQLGPFLTQLNPILRWLEYNQALVGNWISAGITGVAATTASATGGVGHYLRQFGPSGPSTFSLS
ncbi:MAG TPA: MlaD family protein, partial [Solirubrobacteraceae bacterium]|nr:MlaD family protein [Solirubrobacteraceae bacterium]